MPQWIDVCAAGEIPREDLKRFDHEGRTFAIYHGTDGTYYCSDGLCSHEAVHLADGFVMDHVIECPKHLGQFDYRTGEALRAPACIDLKTYPAKVENGRVLIEI